jgi:hypothetical protein
MMQSESVHQVSAATAHCGWVRTEPTTDTGRRSPQAEQLHEDSLRAAAEGGGSGWHSQDGPDELANAGARPTVLRQAAGTRAAGR